MLLGWDEGMPMYVKFCSNLNSRLCRLPDSSRTISFQNDFFPLKSVHHHWSLQIWKVTYLHLMPLHIFLGLSRRATGFTTRSDIGPARFAPDASYAPSIIPWLCAAASREVPRWTCLIFFCALLSSVNGVPSSISGHQHRPPVYPLCSLQYPCEKGPPIPKFPNPALLVSIFSNWNLDLFRKLICILSGKSIITLILIKVI